MAVREEILINVTPQETRVALVENGVLQEIHLERSHARGIVGNIFKGKVTRVLPGMQAAFIDIGLDKKGFLHARDVIKAQGKSAGKEGSRTGDKLITELLHEGEMLWVQVLKDPLGTKGARLTTEISLPSRNLVYLPNGAGIGVSQKIGDSRERDRLKTAVEQQCKASELQGGLIIRTSAELVSDDEIAKDIRFLQKLWLKIFERMKHAKACSMVHEEMTLLTRIMRDLVNDDVEKIHIDSKEAFDKVADFVDELMPEVANRIAHYSDEQPIFGLYNVEQEIQQALKRQVDLNSGGYIIIDQTEAMTTVDVNTGSFVGHGNQEDTLFKTNLEAVNVIAHQIRVRNLGGIIIIDFIDMQKQKHKQQVLESLKSVLSKDRVKTKITDMSPLGLVEITRKRTRESLERHMCESCAVCEGRGMVKTVETVCYEILREMLAENHQFKAQSYTIIASQVVVNRFLDKAAASLADLQSFIDRPINLQVDSLLEQEQYDIVLA